MSELLIERRGAVEIATLNRPERLNALNAGLVGELGTYFGGLAERTDIRVVILRGAGSRRDRKSTRLNSSSLMRISYAVFCLKKKTKSTKIEINNIINIIIHLTLE